MSRWTRININDRIKVAVPDPRMRSRLGAMGARFVGNVWSGQIWEWARAFGPFLSLGARPCEPVAEIELGSPPRSGEGIKRFAVESDGFHLALASAGADEAAIMLGRANAIEAELARASLRCYDRRGFLEEAMNLAASSGQSTLSAMRQLLAEDEE